MSIPPKVVCLCGHAPSSHDGDRCKHATACGCERYRAAYPVYEHYLPAGVTVIRSTPIQSGLVLVECAHDPGYRRDHDGALRPRCPICKGDAHTTAGFELPVKKLALVAAEFLRPRGIPQGQEALF